MKTTRYLLFYIAVQIFASKFMVVVNKKDPSYS